MPSSRHVFLAVLLTFITICGISNCLWRAQASVTSPTRTTSVGGRWQLVHTSLGLGPLPATIAASLPTFLPQSSHRIDFRNRKRAEAPRLRFARDALRKPRVSLKELVVSFRRIALEEGKADVTRPDTKKGRSRSRRASVTDRKAHRNIPLAL